MGHREPGQKCKKALELLEKLGPMSSRQLCQLVGARTNNMNDYMMRSADLGFVTYKTGRRNIADPKIYTIAPDWRTKYAETYTKPPRKSRARVRTKWNGISSVFQLGQSKEYSRVNSVFSLGAMG